MTAQLATRMAQTSKPFRTCRADFRKPLFRQIGMHLVRPSAGTTSCPMHCFYHCTHPLHAIQSCLTRSSGGWYYLVAVDTMVAGCADHLRRRFHIEVRQYLDYLPMDCLEEQGRRMGYVPSDIQQG